MGKGVKKFIIWIGAMIILLAGVNWQYPFSPFSITKTVTYQADPIFLDEYKQDLEEFKAFYQRQSIVWDPMDVTTNWTQYILQMYEQPWLLDKKTSRVKYEDLDQILMELETVRGTLIDLIFREEYKQDTKMYLKMTLEDILYLEESVEILIDSKFNLRSDLKRQLHNLHIDFDSNLDAFSTFYREYKEER